MRGRFRFPSAGYVDELAIAKARNPYYREYPPGVANEPVELPVLYGLVDFVIYVLLIFPFALSDQALFFLWALTIPFGFLSAVMPVGPVSYWHWHRSHHREPEKVSHPEELLVSLRAKHQYLQELAVQSVRVETELTKGLENAGDLRFAFETQIRQAQETRAQIAVEMAKIETQITALELKSF